MVKCRAVNTCPLRYLARRQDPASSGCLDIFAHLFQYFLELWKKNLFLGLYLNVVYYTQIYDFSFKQTTFNLFLSCPKKLKRGPGVRLEYLPRMIGIYNF